MGNFEDKGMDRLDISMMTYGEVEALVNEVRREMSEKKTR